MSLSYTWNSRRQKVQKKKLLLVEGFDETNLFEKILEEMEIKTFQVFEAGGKDQFRIRLDLILKDAKASSINLSCIGIVRDAHNDGKATYDSVCDTLRHFNLAVPPKPRQLAEGNTNIAILIVPNDSGPGSIEDLCWKSVQSYPAAKCAESFVACLQENNTMNSNNLGKTLVHAFLASREDPTTTVGVAAQKSYWPLSNPAFGIVKEFIQLLANCP